MTAAQRGWVRVLATVTVVVALDQISKALVVASIGRGDQENVFFGLNLVNVRNSGVAFGALSGSGPVVVIAVTLALIGLLVYFLVHAGTPGHWLPVGMVLGGAIGNLVDRARLGAVVDFIDPVLWPAFNLADMAIVIGILGVVYVAETQ
jgi:signal peptidase II